MVPVLGPSSSQKTSSYFINSLLRGKYSEIIPAPQNHLDGTLVMPEWACLQYFANSPSPGNMQNKYFSIPRQLADCLLHLVFGLEPESHCKTHRAQEVLVSYLSSLAQSAHLLETWTAIDTKTLSECHYILPSFFQFPLTSPPPHILSKITTLKNSWGPGCWDYPSRQNRL